MSRRLKKNDWVKHRLAKQNKVLHGGIIVSEPQQIGGVRCCYVLWGRKTKQLVATADLRRVRM